MRKLFVLLVALFTTLYINGQDTIEVDQGTIIEGKYFLRVYKKSDTINNNVPNIFFNKKHVHKGTTSEDNILIGGKFENSDKSIAVFGYVVYIDRKLIKPEKTSNKPQFKYFMKNLRPNSIIDVICKSDDSLSETFEITEEIYEAILKFYEKP